MRKSKIIVLIIAAVIVVVIAALPFLLNSESENLTPETRIGIDGSFIVACVNTNFNL